MDIGFEELVFEDCMELLLEQVCVWVCVCVGGKGVGMDVMSCC